MSSPIGIQARARRSIRAKEPDGLLVSEEEVIAGRICDCGVGLGSEEDVELVDSRLEVQSPLSIPTSCK